MASWQTPFDPQAAESDPNKKILAIHAALIPIGSQGSVLYYSGNKWDSGNHNSGNVDHSALLDYAMRTVTNPHSPPDGPGYYDTFCSGHALLADGRVVVGGGTSTMGINDPSNPHDGHWGGLRQAWVFDPRASALWGATALMNPYVTSPSGDIGGGRWYPSLIALASGGALALCGHPFVHDPEQAGDDGRHNNNTPEIYSPSTNAWTMLAELGEGFLHSFAIYYPRAYVLPSGLILIAQPLFTDDHYGDAGGDANASTDGTLGPSQDPTHQYALATLACDPDTLAVVHACAGPQVAGGNDYLNPGFAAQPTTGTLLPLLPETNYRPRILMAGAVNAVIGDFTAGSEASWAWHVTSPRMIAQQRHHSTAVLLANGQVFISGGMDETLPVPTPDQYDAIRAVKVPEIYDPATDTWSALSATPATVARGYHSTALLMLDGRVWTAGSEVNDQFGGGGSGAEYRIEMFEPDYIAATNRPQITDSPPSIGYGQSFTVRYSIPAASPYPTIQRVAVSRFGSSTHGHCYDQRYVGLVFTASSAGHLTVTAPPDGNIAPPGYYMLWILDAGGRPCTQAAVLRIGAQQMMAVLDRSTFSSDELVPGAMATTTFANAFYVDFAGFIPNELTGELPTAMDIAFSVPGISAQVAATPVGPNPSFTLPGSPQLIQHTFYAFDLVFHGAQAFAGVVGPDGALAVTMTIKSHTGHYQCQATLTLVNEPSPYMLDGTPPWLSVDLRVFQMTASDSSTYYQPTFGDPNTFVTNLVDHCNSHPADGTHLFEDVISADQQTSHLTLQHTTDGTATGPRVYNFALARVRLKSQITNPAANANTIRVMFRLFRTTTPSIIYDNGPTFRRHVNSITDPYTGTPTTDAIPLLGLDTDGEIVAIPCFAAARVTPAQDMVNQDDPVNLQQIVALANTEVDAYFGCWLDINNPDDGRFPASPGMATSFGSVPPTQLKSIFDLIGDFHQCLVAEIYYKPDTSAPELVHAGETPFTSDKLAQRNLAFGTSGNPGAAATRTVQHTFELKARTAKGDDRRKLPLDELVIWWTNVPRSSVATLYLPDLAAQEVLALVPPAYGQSLYATGPHTIRCTVGDHTVIPLPAHGRRITGLLTVELPAGVRKGQRYRVVAQQVSGTPRRVIGAFEVRIDVFKDAELLAADLDRYAILLFKIGRLVATDRFRPVLVEYARQLAERIRVLGVDPATVKPSPYGVPARHHHHHRDDDDRLRFAAELDLPEGTEIDLEIKSDVRVRIRRRDD